MTDWIDLQARISIHAPLAGSDPKRWLRELIRGLFQSTLPLRGATVGDIADGALDPISIHAPLAGSDTLKPRLIPCLGDFNPRSPCGERLGDMRISLRQFDFNPRSPCGERPRRIAWPGGMVGFQSTLPLRGATLDRLAAEADQTISIHAPLAGSDGCGGRRF